jgi:hypothetical protein
MEAIMRPWWMGLLVAGLYAGCGGAGEAERGGEEAHVEQAGGDVSASDPDDPCALVTQPEMERFIGPLLEPPYRTNDRRANPAGTGCLYRAQDYRNVTIELDREYGELGFRMMVGMGGQVEEALVGARSSPAVSPDGDWDRLGRAFGQLLALKGPASIQIDPLGSRLDLDAQIEILRIALARLSQPLAYDGAGAARRHRDVGVEPRDPCSLVSRAEAEALMGRLRAEPHPSEDGDACMFPMDLQFLGTPVDRALEVQWSDGFYAFGQERLALGMAAGSMARAMGPDLPAVGEHVAHQQEPWDERITLLGGVITVIRRDVLLRIAADGMAGFDEDRALALLRTAVGRI